MLKNSNFSLCNKYCQLLSWSASLSWFVFKERSTKCLPKSENLQFIFQLLFAKHSEWRGIWRVSSQAVSEGLFREHSSCFSVSQKCIVGLAVSSHGVWSVRDPQEDPLRRMELGTSRKYVSLASKPGRRGRWPAVLCHSGVSLRRVLLKGFQHDFLERILIYL